MDSGFFLNIIFGGSPVLSNSSPGVVKYFVPDASSLYPSPSNTMYFTFFLSKCIYPSTGINDVIGAGAVVGAEVIDGTGGILLIIVKLKSST